MTATTLTTRDVAAISCWARTTWRVARSHHAHTPDRPEAEGGPLTDAAITEFGPHAYYEARRGGGITIYHSTRTGLLQFQRETLHQVPWNTVAAWLNTWTSTDRDTLIHLERERFNLEHSAEELTYNPAATTAQTMAIARRREQRMAAGDRDTIRTLTHQMDDLTAQYLTGQHAPAPQLELFCNTLAALPGLGGLSELG